MKVRQIRITELGMAGAAIADEMLGKAVDHIKHIREWASQDHSELTSQQVVDAIVRICDDFLGEPASEQINEAELLTPDAFEDMPHAVDIIASEKGL